MNLGNLFKELESLNLPPGQFAIFGSGPLAAHGIRETSDIDIIVLPELYSHLQNEGWEEKTQPSGSKYLTKGNFEAWEEWNCGTYNPDIKKLIKEVDFIQGIPFVKLEEVKKWKQFFSREKDLKDVELIDQYLAKHGKII